MGQATLDQLIKNDENFAQALSVRLFFSRNFSLSSEKCLGLKAITDMPQKLGSKFKGEVGLNSLILVPISRIPRYVLLLKVRPHSALSLVCVYVFQLPVTLLSSADGEPLCRI
jgi:hypothetical protein